MECSYSKSASASCLDQRSLPWPTAHSRSMSEKNLSAKDEALLILEYLENEHLPRTFLNFLDESEHLRDLRARLYGISPADGHDAEGQEFQRFFHVAKQLVSPMTDPPTSKSTHDLYFDEDFLNDLIRQSPPVDHLPDTPAPSVPPNKNAEHEDLPSTVEQQFVFEPSISLHQIVEIKSEINDSYVSSGLVSTVPYTKCIVVTQDFLQSMCNPKPIEVRKSSGPKIRRRRQRRLKLGKENYSQQRRLMPRSSAGN